MHSYENRLQRAAEAIQSAEALVIGGGAGLSAAAGLTYSGPRFARHFADFIEEYGLKDMYSSAFYPFKTEEELWAYWARHIWLNRYATGPTALYAALRRLAAGRPHFVVTTNVEYQFHKAGFAPGAVWMVQGDYGLLQCAVPCHEGLYDNERQVNTLREATVNCRVPAALVPRCPRCGGPMQVYIHSDDAFIQGKAWHAGEAAYMDFLNQAHGRRTVYLELGVGYNTPGIIRYPFEQMVYQNPHATLLRLNRDDTTGTRENEAATIAFAEDMNEVIPTLAALCAPQGTEKSGAKNERSGP